MARLYTDASVSEVAWIDLFIAHNARIEYLQLFLEAKPLLAADIIGCEDGIDNTSSPAVELQTFFCFLSCATTLLDGSVNNDRWTQKLLLESSVVKTERLGDYQAFFNYSMLVMLCKIYPCILWLIEC